MLLSQNYPPVLLYIPLLGREVANVWTPDTLGLFPKAYHIISGVDSS